MSRWLSAAHLAVALCACSSLSALALAQSSAGCGAPPPSATGPLTVGGAPRSFTTVLPEPYDPDTPHALVLAFHGRTSPAEEVRSYYGLEDDPALAAETVFVYPRALPQADGTFGWWHPGDPPDALRDFAFFDALLAHLGAAYCLERARVYAVGHSLGGSFVNALGCHRAGVLRAVGSLGAGPAAGPCAGSVAAMVLHHPEDALVPFRKGEAAREQFLAQNGLSGPPTPAEPLELNCVRYGQAAAPHPVVWCPHSYGEGYDGRPYTHVWPPGTGAALLRFFRGLPPP